jgi:prevent-host-death family protein
MTNVSIAVPLAEAKSKLSELIERVSQGEEFVITRHDTEIARLIPAHRPGRGNVSEAIARMRAGRQERRASTAELRQWREEGRR